MSDILRYGDPDVAKLAGTLGADVQAIMAKFLPDELDIDRTKEGSVGLGKTLPEIDEYVLVPPTDEPTVKHAAAVGMVLVMPEVGEPMDEAGYYGYGGVVLKNVAVIVNDKERRTMQVDRRAMLGIDPEASDHPVFLDFSSGVTKTTVVPHDTDQESTTNTHQDGPRLQVVESLEELDAIYNRMRAAIITGVHTEARQRLLAQS